MPGAVVPHAGICAGCNMDYEVAQEAQNLISRLEEKDQNLEVRVATNDEIAILQERLDDCLPDWFIKLISSISLIDAEFGFKEFEPEEDFDGISYIIWADPSTIIEECLDAVPGCAIFEKGYICIASCSHGSGDPIFMPINKGTNPPVYRVYHEYGEDTELILKQGMNLISEKLSELFKNAIL